MLTDTIGRQFRYLRLSITDVCNFRCNYCLPDGYSCASERNFLTVKEISRLVTAFAQLGTEKIRITGGEPSLRKDLPEIIHTVKQIKGVKQVALTTNGYQLNKQIAQWQSAGLDALNVSIDSLSPHQFKAITGHDKLSDILQGIEKAIDLGITTIKINTVLMKQFNANEIQFFIDWVKDKPISLRFIELMQTGDNLAFFKQQHLSGEHIQQHLLNNDWQLKAPSITAGPAKEYTHANSLGSVGLIMPYSKDFCQSCNRLRVSALGKLHLCLFAEQGESLRELLQEDDTEALKSKLKHLLADKKASHFLHDEQVGATTHLAMLGG